MSLYLDVLDIAFDACLSRCGFDISACDKEEQDAIFLAVIDALPQGKDAAARAAEETLRSLAVAGGWEEWIDYRP